jgi:hypothetical protein
VRVGNRGTERADNVAVRVWRREYRDRDEPLWNDGTWTEIKGPSKTRHIEPDAEVEADAHVGFGPFPFTPASGKRYLLLAEATCDADRANSDPATGLPCSREKTPLADLVANDNNLGLVVVPYP